MISPFNLFLIVSFSGILVFMIFLVIGSVDFHNEDNTEMRFYECSSDGLVREFDNHSEISGYTRTEQKNGNINLVCFVQNNENDDAFPEVLIYVENTGEKTYTLKQSFKTAEGKKASDDSISSIGSGCGKWFACQTDFFKGRLIMIFESHSDSREFTLNIT